MSLGRALRRWRARRQYARLDKTWQKLIAFIGEDPESLIERGLL